MVRYQVFLGFDTYYTDAISINKLCKLNFRYFTMYLVTSQQQGQGYMTKIKILSFITFTSLG